MRVSTQLQLLELKSTDPASNLDVVMDSDPTLQRHINTIAKPAFYYMKKSSRIKGLISQQVH